MDEGTLLWEPAADRVAAARITDFAAAVGRPGALYEDLWQWSVDDLDGFWSAFASWAGIRWKVAPSAVLGSREMPGAEWFPGARLNYAEHLLYPACGVAKDDVAVIFVREDGLRTTLTYVELRTQVAAVRAFLVEVGVGVGDRVAALLPNCPEALVAMLATTSLGAIWSSCSPDFGARAVADRFTQVAPAVLLAVDGYVYGGRTFDVRATVASLLDELPSVRAVVRVPYVALPRPDTVADDSGEPQRGEAGGPVAVEWQDVVSRPATLAFEYVAFDAPLWVLFSSGTTGLPKPIVHGHGGILLEHTKQLALHLDLRRGNRFFWFSTTGWMMWNLLVSGLAVGATVVLYDGSPAHPGVDALWRLAADERITAFGVSAPFVQACMKAGISLAGLDLGALRAVGSTGAPLPPEGFEWIYAQAGSDVMLSSLSGGTDVCTAFVGGAPTLAVRSGEIPCRMLGSRVEAYSAAGEPLVGAVGELVVTAPMPSMPVMFWNDADGSRLREAYFEDFPGVWRHGDWIRINASGSCVIYGRSDATLNRGGVRMGTAEFYRVVEEHPDVVDSLVIDTSAADVEGELLLFVVLGPGANPNAVAEQLRRAVRADLSPRHVPDVVEVIDEVPRTLNGKKCEVPVKRVLAGVPLDEAVSQGALKNPAAMAPFVARSTG